MKLLTRCEKWFRLHAMRIKVTKTVCYVLLSISALSFSFGCAARNGRGTSSETLAQSAADGGDNMVDKRMRDYLTAQEAASNDPYARDVLLRTAKAALGTPYVRGGSTTKGFDCSGFVQWTYHQVGVNLPRTAREQARTGRPVLNPQNMQVGDIVAFRHPKRGYHTGIYVGEGKFIHSPRKRTRVRVAALDDPYFSGIFLGARRVAISNTADVAAAEKIVAELDKERAKARLHGHRPGVKTKKAANPKKLMAAASSKAGKKIRPGASVRGKVKTKKIASPKIAADFEGERSGGGLTRLEKIKNKAEVFGKSKKIDRRAITKTPQRDSAVKAKLALREQKVRETPALSFTNAGPKKSGQGERADMTKASGGSAARHVRGT